MNNSQTAISQYYKYYLGLLVIINILPFAAPLLLAVSPEGSIGFHISKAIYFIYSFSCHQFDSRSIHLFDYQLAWCARDVAIWLGILTGAILVWRHPQTKIKWYWLILFILPIALDGGIQTLSTISNLQSPIYLSNNFTRFLTGSWFGLGISVYLSGLMLSEAGIEERVEGREARGPIRTTHYTLLISMLSMLLIYITLISLWSLTSRLYPPVNILDSVPKVAEGDFYSRRRHGLCPADSRDLLALKCFLN